MRRVMKFQIMKPMAHSYTRTCANTLKKKRKAKLKNLYHISRILAAMKEQDKVGACPQLPLEEKLMTDCENGIHSAYNICTWC
jgi:predicted nucleotidyltransferase